MTDHVYRKFKSDELSETCLNTRPFVSYESGTYGSRCYLGHDLVASASISLFGGVRSRYDVGRGSISSSGIELYPLAVTGSVLGTGYGFVDSYPQTSSIKLYTCSDLDDDEDSESWYEGHYHTISLLFDWYNKNVRTTYKSFDLLTSSLRVIDIPSIFYGKRITTGSIYLYDNSYYSLTGTIKYVDDCYGNIILSGSDITSKVGNVFYSEGLIVLTDPLILSSSVTATFGNGAYYSGSSDDTLYHIEFKGDVSINSKVMMCRMGSGDVNASNNPSYYTVDVKGRIIPRYIGSATYITSIGIYNEERQLVAVAKLAQPIRKREKDRLDIKLRLDF
jgi:hypothetical protein